MVSRLEKHGDGQALVLDRSLLDMLNIDSDTLLQVQVSDGALIVTPLSAPPSQNEDAQRGKAQSAEPRPVSDVGAYPAPLMREYHALTDKKLRRTISSKESARLQEVRSRIAALDEQQTEPDTWTVQAAKLRAELAALRAEVEALPDAAPADK